MSAAERDVNNPGRVAYEAYRRKSKGKSLASGVEIPEWADQAPEIRAAWDAAGRAVADLVLDEVQRVADLAHASITQAKDEVQGRMR